MSPIKGISETRRLPRLGKIHLGIKKQGAGGTEYPSAVDYFVFTEDNPLYASLINTFGQQPRQMNILIPVDDEEQWCSQYYRCYSRTRGLVCKGDGETAIRMVDAKAGGLAKHDSEEVAMQEIECLGRDCPEYEVQCREIMNLQFLLPDVPGLGIWQIDTSSINSMRNINSAAELIRRIYGRVSMIPLLLALEPQEVQDKAGKRRTVNCLNLRTNQTIFQLMENAAKPPAVTGGSALVLPPPDDEVPEMVIPQAQEGHQPVVQPETKEVQPEGKEKPTEKAKAKKAPAKAKVEKPAAKAPAKKPEPPVAASAPVNDLPSTQEHKKKVVAALRAINKTDEEIRLFFYNNTSKKGGWLTSEIDKLLALAQKMQKVAAKTGEPVDEIDTYLKDEE